MFNNKYAAYGASNLFKNNRYSRPKFSQSLTRTRDNGYVMVGQDKQYVSAIQSYCYFI